MASRGGGISVGYRSGWLAETIGSRATFGVAALLPVLVVLSVPFARPGRGAARVTATAAPGNGGPPRGGQGPHGEVGGLRHAPLRVLPQVVRRSVYPGNRVNRLPGVGCR